MARSGGTPTAGALSGAFLGCVAIWGSTFLLIAIGNDQLPPVWAATLRLLLASAILFGVMAIRGLPFPRGPALTACALYGFFQFGLNLPLLYMGETQVPSGFAAVMFATVPLSSMLLARAYGLERLSRRRVGAALVALVGIAVMFSGRLRAAAHPLPMLEVLLATWVACFGSVYLKRGPRQSPIVTNAVGSLVGCVACLVWTLALREPIAIPGSWAAILPVVYLAVAGSVGAFVLWAWLVNYWDISRTAYIGVLAPMVAVALGAWVRHERLGAATLLGALIVLAGVALGLGAAAQPSSTSRPSKASTG